MTKKIRDGLREAGKLETKEKDVTKLKSYNLSEAMKGDPSTYVDREGEVVQFHQNCKGGFKRGDRYTLGGIKGDAVHVTNQKTGEVKSLPLQNAERFDVYRESTVGLSVGDKVRFSLGGTGTDGKQRISNGRLDEVEGFDRSGNLLLKSGFKVDRNYGHLDLGYVVTSHASQGKDRKLAIAAMGAESLPAINAKQFYVTVSRGSEDVAIYVDDKAKVRRAIARSGEQLSATELISAAKQGSVPERKHEQEQEQQRSYFQSFRSRVASWYHSFRQQGSDREPVGRHRQGGSERGNERGRSIGPEFGGSL